jgi:hypothetical protein
MLYRGHAYVRLSQKLAGSLGMTYRTMWNALKDDDCGLNVLRVPTRQPGKRLIYVRLADINRMLGLPLFGLPTLAGPGLHDAVSDDEHTDTHDEETDDADHQTR